MPIEIVSISTWNCRGCLAPFSAEELRDLQADDGSSTIECDQCGHLMNPPADSFRARWMSWDRYIRRCPDTSLKPKLIYTPEEVSAWRRTVFTWLGVVALLLLMLGALWLAR